MTCKSASLIDPHLATPINMDSSRSNLYMNLPYLHSQLLWGITTCAVHVGACSDHKQPCHLWEHFLLASHFTFKTNWGQWNVCSIACIASVSIRPEQNQAERNTFFAFGLLPPFYPCLTFNAAWMLKSYFALPDCIWLIQERLLRGLAVLQLPCIQMFLSVVAWHKQKACGKRKRLLVLFHHWLYFDTTITYTIAGGETAMGQDLTYLSENLNLTSKWHQSRCDPNLIYWISYR